MLEPSPAMTKEFDSTGKVDGEPEIRKREIEPLHRNRSELQRRIDFEAERTTAYREAKRHPELRLRAGLAFFRRLAARLDH